MKYNNKETFCERAGIFYYDYIQGAKLYRVEPEIFRHIEKCPFCRGEIERLKVILAEPAYQTVAEKTNQKDTQVTTILASHFNLMNKEVTCGIAKRFLTSLAGLSFDIKIPTPITVHIVNCCQCKYDLETIRKLRLTDEQLTRLGRVVASQMVERSEECEIHSELIESSATLDFDNDTLALLRHIIERQESGIVTEYITKGRMNIKTSDNLYSDYMSWPVEVAVHDRKKETTDRTDLTRSLADRHSHIKQLIKPLAAVAAVIFVAVWFFVGTFAKAIEFNDIYNAIGKVRNICLIKGTSVIDGAAQKVWISKDLNIKLFCSAGHWILWDVQNKVKKSWSTESAYLETNELDDAELTNVEQTMDVPLILLPFQTPYSLPNGYDWKLLPAKEVTGQFSNTQVYDLLWSNKTANGSLVYYRWRAYINKDTLLPERIENWQKYSSTGKYELKNWMDITYPQIYEIKKLIRDTGLVPK